MSFGDFIKLYELFYEKYSIANSMKNFLWPVKFLRNAAAHNNCLLNNLKDYKTIKPNNRINNYVSTIPGISKEGRKKKMSNPVIHDFVVTLYVFNTLEVSSQIKKNVMSELIELMDSRFLKNKNYFKDNQLLVSYYDFVKVIVDYFYLK